MSEEPAPSSPPPRSRTVVHHTTTGAVVRWEAPTAEEMANAIPGLKVLELCGVGGMGAVYRAEQERLGRIVAVKILPAAITPDEEARIRFEREARILSGIAHPHVLQIHDFGKLHDNTLYLVTEWASGGDLAKLLDARAHSMTQVRAWVRQIADALTAAHAQGIIHRDLKPANVLVLSDGRLTLADFGLAHTTPLAGARPLTSSGALFGTFEYMAPEQMESAGKVTPATDLYALGVMTYQMLTGRVPRGAYARASRLAHVPTQVDAFLNDVMATDPARRPRDAAEFVRLFDRACRTPERRRHRQLVGLGVALVLLTLAWARAVILRAETKAAEAEARMVEMIRRSPPAPPPASPETPESVEPPTPATE